MKIKFYDPKDGIEACTQISNEIKNTGSISVGDVIGLTYLGEYIDAPSFNADVDALGWVSVDGIKFRPDLDGNWYLELPDPVGISPEIKIGVKIEENTTDKEKAEKSIEKRIVVLEERIADLDRRVWGLEHPEWKHSYHDRMETAKTNSFLDRVNSFLDSVTGGNS